MLGQRGGAAALDAVEGGPGLGEGDRGDGYQHHHDDGGLEYQQLTREGLATEGGDHDLLNLHPGGSGAGTAP
ncbi:hypothetical protein [Streptomyces blattellae]|uniref:hypothetical protein n=1 Tax=Streptomyces blattellae TaxID=2569855 RepID=UPI0012B7F3B9|nr:hypothetical protein [Streptomyces blattellae]